MIVRCPHDCPAKLDIPPDETKRCGLCGGRVAIVRGRAVAVAEEAVAS